jgi:hypothetical protein
MDEPMKLVQAATFDFNGKPYDAAVFERFKTQVRGMWVIVKSKDREFCYSPIGEELPIDTLTQFESSDPPVYEVHG